MFILRSSVYSRGVNSAELFCFFVITRSPRAWILMNIGGNCSYKPPGALSTLQALKKQKQREIIIFKVHILKSGGNHNENSNIFKSQQHLSPGRFRCAESEFEIKNQKIWQPDVNSEEKPLKSKMLFFCFSLLLAMFLFLFGRPCKVIGMMEDLEAKIKKAGEKADAAFKEFFDWCDYGIRVGRGAG